jgi:hypothetical protein
MAAVYLVLCSAGSLYYISLLFRPNAATVHGHQQALCLAFTIAAGTYFLRARIGHLALTVLTVLTLIAIGTNNPEATAFHLCVLLVLVVPFMRKQDHDSSANKTIDQIPSYVGNRS